MYFIVVNIDQDEMNILSFIFCTKTKLKLEKLSCIKTKLKRNLETQLKLN